MIAAFLGVDVIIIEAGLLTWALIRRPRDEQPVYATPAYDPAAEARTVILPAVDLDGREPDRVRPYVKHLPTPSEASPYLDPQIRRVLAVHYSVAKMLSVNRQWQQLALGSAA